MKIIHVSDIHIRNFKYRSEYAKAFEDFYTKAKKINPDLIINTGDTVHSKLAVSPELFEDVTDHFIKTSNIAPYLVILGNHDLNLKNASRLDAISPIVSAIKGRTVNPVILLREGLITCKQISKEVFRNNFEEFNFWNFDIRGHNNSGWNIDSSKVNIGLFHGSISNCITDLGFKIENGEAELSKFHQMDYMLLGDIHKRQSFNNNRIAYPGSLIQQNYGEEIEKGFLVWDIESKEKFSVEFVKVETPGRFYTVQVPADLDISEIDIPKNSRIKAIIKSEVSPATRLSLDRKIRTKFSPLELIIPDSTEQVNKVQPSIDDVIVDRYKVMSTFLKEKGLDDNEIISTIELFKHYESLADSDSTGRGTVWKLKNLHWDNMMNYGENNFIDCSKIPGLVGIFAPNASGKSSIFDIFLESVFDKVSKDVPRNIDLINDNKDVGIMKSIISIGDKDLSIDRKIERISFGQRKNDVKQWGKTSLEASLDGVPINGTTRPETERSIRSLIGTFDDFVMTAMVTQNPVIGVPGAADIINCKETDRRKILFRFLDLDIFESVLNLAKNDHKEFAVKVKGLDIVELQKTLEKFFIEKNAIEQQNESDAMLIEAYSNEIDILNSQIASSDLQKIEDSDSKARSIKLKLQNLEKQKNEILSRIKSFNNECIENKNNADKLSQSVPSNPEISLQDVIESIDKLKNNKDLLSSNFKTQNANFNSGMKSLKLLDNIPCGNQFPDCKFIKEASSFLSIKDELQDGLKNLGIEISNIDEKIDSLSKIKVIHEEVLVWNKKSSEHKLKHLELQNELLQLANLLSSVEKNIESENLELQKIESNEDSLAKLNELKELLAAFKKELARCQMQLSANTRKLGALDTNILNTQKTINDFNDASKKVTLFENLFEMCGKNGLPYRILKIVIPLINAEIAKILNGIVKFSVSFDDNEEDQTVSLLIKYGDFKSRPLSLGSGAEKFISGLAIRVALLSISSLPKTDMLIIDEGFGKLDAEHLESVQKMFEVLRQSFTTVFIISHVDSMRDLVDHSIEITSENGYAHVEV